MKKYFPDFLCAFICRYDATNGYRFTFGLGSRYVGHSSVLIRECVGRLHAIRCYVGLHSVLNRPWIDVRSADICPIHNRSKTDKPSTIGGRTLPDKTDTTPTYNRQTTDNLSGSDLSNMFERSLPDKFVCPNINRHQTDITESIPTVNRSLPEFDDFCRFDVGFVSVWPVWLGYKPAYIIRCTNITHQVPWCVAQLCWRGSLSTLNNRTTHIRMNTVVWTTRWKLYWTHVCYGWVLTMETNTSVVYAQSLVAIIMHIPANYSCDSRTVQQWYDTRFIK